MDAGVQDKRVFATFKALYRFTVMLFSLCNAPTIFERLMDLVLKEPNSA